MKTDQTTEIEKLNKRDIDSYKNLLELFRCKDPLKLKWMQKPFVIGDNIYATDGFCMVWFNKELMPNFSEYDSYEFNKISGVIPSIMDLNKLILVDEIKTALSKCPLEDDFKEISEDISCEECGGDGKVVWEYESYEREMACPVCDGEGYISRKTKIPTGGKVIASYSTIKIGKCFLSANILDNVVKACELLDTKSITLISQLGEIKSNLFKIEDVSLLVMPMCPPEDDEKVYYTIE